MSEHETEGIPLIIYGWNRHPRWLQSFNIDWLRMNGAQDISVRNVHNWKDFDIPLSDFIERMRSSPVYTSTQEPERLYGKDAECPPEWTRWLTDGKVIPDDLLFHGSKDFLKFLPEMAQVQTLMCYIGIGDTFTPFHKDLCASSGQNLMCYSENNGSSFWFMTRASDAPKVHSYFQQLGHEVDFENHVVTLEELGRAPFEVYIAEQCVGDLVLVPPRSCHQVVNNSGITIKTSWSRMSLDGLRIAFYHELPIYHRVCRREIYKVKAIIYHSMQYHTGLMDRTQPGPELVSLAYDLKQLLDLFDDVLAQDFTAQHASLPHVSQSGSTYSDDIACDFCGADVFQSFFECDKCIPPPSSDNSGVLLLGCGLVLCPSCYVEGRSCRCGVMQPVQCRVIGDLFKSRDNAAKAIEHFECQNDVKYPSLAEHPEWLLEKGAGIFDSACKLHQRRQAGNKTRTCSPRYISDAPHPALATDVIACKLCHFSRCFSHLLEICCIHSVEAILHSDHDGSDSSWHQFHLSSKETFVSAQRAADEDEQAGRRPNIIHRLAHIAMTFNFHRAVNPDLTKSGWYDYIPTLTTPIAPSTAQADPDYPGDASGDRPTSNETHLPDGPSGGQSTSNETSLPDGGSGGGIDDVTQVGRAEDGIDPVLPHPPLQSTSTYVERCGSPSTLSVLTDLPSMPSSPHLPDANLPLASEPSPPVSSQPFFCSSFPPGNALSSTNSSESIPRTSTNGRHKQRYLMDFVDVPQPDWYRKIRGKEKATPKLPARCSETPECDDDIPLRQLVLQYSMTSKQNQAVGPSHSKSDSLPGNIHDAISLDPPAVKIPPVQSPAVRQKADLSGQPSSSRKRKKQLQETLPRSSQPMKRLRSTKSCGRPPNNDLAAVINHSFRPNGEHKGISFTKCAKSDGPDHTLLQDRIEEQRAELSRCEDLNRALKDEVQRLKDAVLHLTSRGQTWNPPSDSQPVMQPEYCSVSAHTNASMAADRPLGGQSAEMLPRHPTPTEPRSHRELRLKTRHPEGKLWKHPYNKHKPQTKGPYSRIPKLYKGGRPRPRLKTIPLEQRLTDYQLPIIMTLPLSSPSPSPARSSDHSQSSGSSSATIQAQLDDSEEYSAPWRSPRFNEELAICSPAPPAHRIPKVSKLKYVNGHASEDEISLGDEDEYLPML